MSRPGAAEVVVATGNPGKLEEFRRLLRGVPCVLLALDAFPELRLPEEADDYVENAKAKARCAAEGAGRIAIADDSGLEVEALDGRPGPLSARYGGPGLDDRGRLELLLAELTQRAPVSRAARFVCAAALAVPGGRTYVEIGVCPGTILEAPRGAEGFGYDPIFACAPGARSMAELSAEEKDQLSHRGRALAALLPRLQEELEAFASRS